MPSISSVQAISRLSTVVTDVASRVDVVVLDVAAVFAQVGGDAVGARALADDGALDGIGIVAAARLAKRRDVIDVDVEALVCHVDGPRQRCRGRTQSNHVVNCWIRRIE